MEVGLMQLQYTAMQSGIGLAIVSSTVTGHSVLRIIQLRLWSSPGYRLYLRLRELCCPAVAADLCFLRYILVHFACTSTM